MLYFHPSLIPHRRKSNEGCCALLTPRQKWYTPSKDYCTRRLDVVHVLDILPKYGRTHADSLIEVRDSLARFAFGVSVKEVCISRLKVELDPGHPKCPKRVRHDFNSGMVGRKDATALLFDVAPLYNATTGYSGHNLHRSQDIAAAVWFSSTYHVTRQPKSRVHEGREAYCLYCSFQASAV